jgi:hypothetical protein
VNARSALVCVLCASLAACASDGRNAAQNEADATTKAVYNDDFGSVTADFDDALKRQVSRAEVGVLSDKLHALGGYKSIDYVDADPGKREYTYELRFDHGQASVVVRLDSNGKLAAYRVFPQFTPRS